MVSSNLKASEPKWVNPNDNQYGVNTLRLGGLQLFIYNIRLKYDLPATLTYNFCIAKTSLEVEFAIINNLKWSKHIIKTRLSHVKNYFQNGIKIYKFWGLNELSVFLKKKITFFPKTQNNLWKKTSSLYTHKQNKNWISYNFKHKKAHNKWMKHIVFIYLYLSIFIIFWMIHENSLDPIQLTEARLFSWFNNQEPETKLCLSIFSFIKFSFDHKSKLIY